MKLQYKVVQSFTLESDHSRDEWEQDDTDGEEGNCDGGVGLVITSAILQFDDVHSSEGIQVSVHKLVSVDEHGDEEGQEQNVEYEHEQGDENGTLFRVLVEFLLPIQTVEDVLEHLEECRFLFLQDFI